jgi:LacI family transcriptional regulator
MTSKLIFVGPVSPSIFAVAEHRGNPTMLIGHPAQSIRATSIVPDYVAAARYALSLLVRNGHRRVGIVGGALDSTEPRISEMYRAVGIASQEAGMPIRAQDIHNGEFGIEYGFHALSSMLGNEFPPTAVFCLDHGTAKGILAGAKSRGISVPGQLSVIALADHAPSESSHLPLTAVVLPVDEMADVAMDEADRQLTAGIPADPRTIVVPAKLMERMTCGPASH